MGMANAGACAPTPTAPRKDTFGPSGTRADARGLGPSSLAPALVKKSARAVPVSSRRGHGCHVADAHAPVAVSVRGAQKVTASAYCLSVRAQGLGASPA